MTDYLARQGVAAGRLSVEGRGPNDPIGDNATAEGRAANRRVEIYLYAVKQGATAVRRARRRARAPRLIHLIARSPS